VGELLDLWLRRTAPKTKSATTMAMVKSLVENHIRPIFGDMKLNALTAEDVERFLDARVATLSRSTLTKLRGVLAQAFDVAVSRRHASWNPARAAELPPEATQRRQGRALSTSDARSLLRVADDNRLGAWIVVSLTLGLRPGEVSGLTWEAIDFDNGVVNVFQSLGWSDTGPALKEPKTRTTRALALPSITLDALKGHKARTNEERLLMGTRWPREWSSLVFVSENGTPLDPSNTRRLVTKLATEAKIKGTVTPYDLRHTATTLMAASGTSADRLADLLGHKDTRMVFAHYRHRDHLTVTAAADFWTEAG
jgi:integrase